MDEKHIMTNRKINFIACKFVRKYTVKYIIISYYNYFLCFLNYQNIYVKCLMNLHFSSTKILKLFDILNKILRK